MVEKSNTKENKENEAKNGRSFLVAVQVRGTAKARKPIIDTLRMLNLGKQNQCAFFQATESIKGMVRKAKDYLTWGEISAEMRKEIILKRGRILHGLTTDRKKKYSYTSVELEGKKYLPYVHLNPPKKGYGRKGIKLSYSAGGALGYRGEKINELLQRMM